MRNIRRGGSRNRAGSYSQTLIRDVKRDRWLYLFLLLPIIYFIVFRYIPIFGLRIAFYDYNVYQPDRSEFVGLQHFRSLFSRDTFTRALRNTVNISLLKVAFGFPAPIILALLLNEIGSVKFKRTTQTILYLPHFISWVVLAGMVMDLLDPSTGIITRIINNFSDRNVQVLTDNRYFVPMLVMSDIYKTMGWGTILYLATISSIDPELYEAASIDGAGPFKQALSITLPALLPTIFVVFTLNLGNVLNAGFDQVFMLYNSLVYETGDIIDTYVYRMGIIQSDYSFSTAAGMFKSVVGLVLILSFNALSKRTVKRSLW